MCSFIVFFCDKLSFLRYTHYIFFWNGFFWFAFCFFAHFLGNAKNHNLAFWHFKAILFYISHKIGALGFKSLVVIINSNCQHTMSTTLPVNTHWFTNIGFKKTYKIYAENETSPKIYSSYTDYSFKKSNYIIIISNHSIIPRDKWYSYLKCRYKCIHDYIR